MVTSCLRSECCQLNVGVNKAHFCTYCYSAVNVTPLCTFRLREGRGKNNLQGDWTTLLSATFEAYKSDFFISSGAI